MQPVNFWPFMWRALDRAATETAHFFGLDVKTVLTTVGLVALGFVLHWRVRGYTETKEEVSKYVILVAAPFLLFITGLLLRNGFRAPYLVYIEENSKAQEQVNKLQQAKENAEEANRTAEARIAILEKSHTLEGKPAQKLHAGPPQVATDKQAIAVGLQQIYDDGQKLRETLLNSDDNLSAEESQKQFAAWRLELRTYITPHVSVGKAQYVDGIASVTSMSYSGMKSVNTRETKEALISHINARMARLSELMKDY